MLVRSRWPTSRTSSPACRRAATRTRTSARSWATTCCGPGRRSKRARGLPRPPEALLLPLRRQGEGAKSSRLKPLLQEQEKGRAVRGLFRCCRLPWRPARRALRAARQRFEVLGLGHQVLLADLEEADGQQRAGNEDRREDRKSTRLNSSH